MAKPRVVVLGAGFGGLEIATMLSDALGEDLDLTLIDRSDAFVFGFSKLDVLFGRQPLDAVRVHYSRIAKPGVRFRREAIRAIDPRARRVVTSEATHDADFLVVALGAGFDFDATPGLGEGGHEFYSVAGAVRAAAALTRFTGGRAVVGVCGAPFKCPPAPSEAALLLHDYLCARGIRAASEIRVVMPLGTPVPPSPETSRAILDAFAERDIEFVPDRLVRALDPARRVAVLDDGSELPYGLFLGVPKHKVPDVVSRSGLAENGWIPVDSKTLATKFPRVWAVGDVTSVGTAKAGVFAEGAARVVAQTLIAELGESEPPAAYTGVGSCYVEFGGDRVGRVEVDFLSGPKPTGTYFEPSTDLVKEKKEFAASRLSKWFGA